MSDLHGWATFIDSHLTREPTASSVLTKWWNSDQMVTKVWFCTRLFKLWSPNLEQRCKTIWLRSLFFFIFFFFGGGGGEVGGIDLDFQGQFELKTLKVYPILSNSNIHPINHPQLRLEPPNLGKRCKTPWLSSLLIWELIVVHELHLICTITLHRFERESPNLHQAWYPGILSAGIENRGHCPCKKKQQNKTGSC